MVLQIINSHYQSVADKFFELTNLQPAGGASLALYRDGESVLDIWAGEANPGKAWQAETCNVVFSSTKGVLSVLVHKAVEQGLIDLDEKVSKYWQEFGCNGKEEITVAMILRHRAGLRAPIEDLNFEDILDVDKVEAAFARQAPIWEPDSGYAYHALSIGHLLGKILFNVTGKRINELLQERISKPLDISLWIGKPLELDIDLANLLTDGKQPQLEIVPNSAEYWDKRAMSYGNAFTAGFDSFDRGFNDPLVHASELAGAGGISNARALAKMYSACVVETDGIRLLTDETILKAIAEPNVGANIYGHPQPHPIHALGFIIANPQHSPAISNTTFGHDGFGGQQAFGDLKTKIGFAYTTNWAPFGEDFFARQREITAELVRLVSS